MTQPDLDQNTTGTTKGRKGPNLSRWFWGTIVILVVIWITLEALAAWQAGSLSDRTSGATATQVEQWLKTAESEAGQVRVEISKMLDEAYDPVYAGIPKYMDFHYSLTGEWLELGSAAMGELGAGLEKHLFDGFDARLKGVSERLVQDYGNTFQGALEGAMADAPGGEEAVGPLVAKALNETRKRIQHRAGNVTVALVGGATLKLFTKAFAKKLAVKLAAKVGAKTGMKWAGAASGAGVGALACSWAGPGAAACAVVGGVITWIGVEVAMIKLDEYVTRDDFDRDLRFLIDEHKKETHLALEKMLAEMVLVSEGERKAVVLEISLSELGDADRSMACAAATGILARYDSIRESLQARSSANAAALRNALGEEAGNPLLAPWIDGISTAIADKDLRPWIDGDIVLEVGLPPEIRDGHEVRAVLSIGEEKIDFAWAEGNSIGRYWLRGRSESRLMLQGSQRFGLELVQDRGLLSRNRSFSGSALFDVSSVLAEGSGLSPRAVLALPVTSNGVEPPMPNVGVTLALEGISLPDRQMPEFCTN